MALHPCNVHLTCTRCPHHHHHHYHHHPLLTFCLSLSRLPFHSLLPPSRLPHSSPSHNQQQQQQSIHQSINQPFTSLSFTLTQHTHLHSPTYISSQWPKLLKQQRWVGMNLRDWVVSSISPCMVHPATARTRAGWDGRGTPINVIVLHYTC